ncbi:MAG: hypothetical protein NTW87_28385, partial [Planctomycetota bacterium]|nr:hypothetical protein [Planctomycetota bacterium]
MNGDADGIIAALAAKRPEELSDGEWQALGFHNIGAAKAGWTALCQRPTLKPLLAGQSRDVLWNLAQSCDPGQAFFGLQRWLEAGGAD